MTPEPLYSEDRRRPGRFWLITIAAVLTVAATVSLGRWQLSRAAQKEALQADIEAQKLKPALTQAEFLAMEKPSYAMHRPVRLRGLWLTPQTVFLDNRQMHGTPGFYVLTPFALEGTEQTVMVQRGWIQRNFVDRTRLGSLRAGRPGTGRRRVFAHPAKSRPGGLPCRDQTAAAHRRVAAAERTGFRGPAARLAGPGAGPGEALRLRIPVVPLKAPRTRWPLLTSRWA